MAAYQAPLSLGFSRQEYEWVAMPCQRYLLNPGIEPISPVTPALQADSLPTELLVRLAYSKLSILSHATLFEDV